MAAKKSSYANEDRRWERSGETVDIPFLVLVLLLLLVGLSRKLIAVDDTTHLLLGGAGCEISK